MPDSTPKKPLPRYTPEKLRTIRKRELALSIEKLAELTHCDAKTIWRYETDRSPINPDFIQKVEQLREEERARRASEEIDFDSVPLPPGRRMVKLIPESAEEEEPPDLYWVPRKKPPTAPGSPEPSPRASAPDSGPGYDRQLMRADLTFAAISILLCVWRRVDPTRRRPEAPGHRWLGRLRWWAATACLVAFLSLMGCLQAIRGASGRTPADREPYQIPDESYAEEAKKGTGGSEPEPGTSIKMPKQPYSWQKLAPCGSGEVEKVGGCWLEPKGSSPPCPGYAVEDEGRCFVPVPARRKTPNTVIPGQ